MKKKTFPVTNIGSASLLMIFIVLSLAAFATLSLSSAAKDYRFSRKIAEHNTAYYDACSKASVRLQEIDHILADAYSREPQHYPEEALASLSGIDGISVDSSGGAPSLTFQTAVSDTQALKVVLTLNEPGGLAGGYYRITAWQEISTSVWVGDDSLKLIE